ncbi:unnamed protein product [Cochlearia groenlandica]
MENRGHEERLAEGFSAVGLRYSFGSHENEVKTKLQKVQSNNSSFRLSPKSGDYSSKSSFSPPLCRHRDKAIRVITVSNMVTLSCLCVGDGWSNAIIYDVVSSSPRLFVHRNNSPFYTILLTSKRPCLLSASPFVVIVSLPPII